GESQFGADGSLVLTGLTRSEQELLDLFAASTHEPLEVVASQCGWGRARAATFLARLPSEVLIEDDAPWSPRRTPPSGRAGRCPASPGRSIAPAPSSASTVSTRWGCRSPASSRRPVSRRCS